MARAFSDDVTDQRFAESVLDAVDEGYETILVVGTTRPFIDFLMRYVASEREPETFYHTNPTLRYSNGQRVHFQSERGNSRGFLADRVLIHPLTSRRAREAAVPCERPRPHKLPRVTLK